MKPSISDRRRARDRASVYVRAAGRARRSTDSQWRYPEAVFSFSPPIARLGVLVQGDEHFSARSRFKWGKNHPRDKYVEKEKREEESEDVLRIHTRERERERGHVAYYVYDTALWQCSVFLEQMGEHPERHSAFCVSRKKK